MSNRIRPTGQPGAPEDGSGLQIIQKGAALSVIAKQHKGCISMNDSVTHIGSALPADQAIVRMLRLDPKHWVCLGISVDSGDISQFSDSEPDSPVIETTTYHLRDLDRGSICIFISMKSGIRHVCQTCNCAVSIKKYVTHQFDSSPLSGMRTKISVRVPQVHCESCGGYPTVRCPLVVFNHTYTKLLKFDALSTLSEETVSATSSACRVGEGIVFDILDDAVQKGLETQDLSDVNTLFIDEIQSTHGQNYISMGADQNHRAISGVLDHNIESVRETSEWLKSKGCDPDQIEYVCCDMSTAYKSGVKKYFKNAKIIIDHFHLNKSVNDALDAARKRTNRELKANGLEYPKNVKYTVLHREKNHNDVHKERMNEIRLYNPELAKAFDLKEEFFEFFSCPDPHTARSAFFRWYNHARASKIPEMVDVARRMLKRLNDILRWFDHRISNAVSEGLNNAYKKIKSAAFGYRKPENLINMCLFRKGRLDVVI